MLRAVQRRIWGGGKNVKLGGHRASEASDTKGVTCACTNRHLQSPLYVLLTTDDLPVTTHYYHLLLPTYCPLPTAYCLLPTAHCPLLTAYCLLLTAYC